MKVVVPPLRYLFSYLLYIIIIITECGTGKDCKREQCCRGSCMATGIDPKRGFDAPQRSQYWLGDTLIVNETVSFFLYMVISTSHLNVFYYTFQVLIITMVSPYTAAHVTICALSC